MNKSDGIKLSAFQVYKLTDALALSLRAWDPVVKAANAPASSATQLMIQYEYLTGHLPRQGSMMSTYLIKWTILDTALLMFIGWLHIPGVLQSRLRLAKYIPLLFIGNSTIFGQLKASTLVMRDATRAQPSHLARDRVAYRSWMDVEM